MARVTLVFSDAENGDLDVSVESDPPIPNYNQDPTVVLTLAQQAGIRSLMLVINEMKQVKDEEENNQD